MRAWRKTTALLAVMSVGVAACGAAPPKPAPPVKAELVSAADVNPDANGRASPVVVRVYQLKEEGAFNSADFFSLYDHEQEALGPSLVNREEYVLAPGEKRSLELKIDPAAQFIAAIAAYRDVRSAHWKAITPPAPQGLTNFLGKATVTLSAGKSELTIQIVH
jgi:type VI secretion system protein VasD